MTPEEEQSKLLAKCLAEAEQRIEEQQNKIFEVTQRAVLAEQERDHLIRRIGEHLTQEQDEVRAARKATPNTDDEDRAFQRFERAAAVWRFCKEAKAAFGVDDARGDAFTALNEFMELFHAESPPKEEK
jgi:hypothetical protein